MLTACWIVIVSRQREVAFVSRGTWREIKREHPTASLYPVPSGTVVDGLPPRELIALVDAQRGRTR